MASMIDAPSTGKPSATRRIARPGSPTWSAMLDAAERILLEEGAAALTSRRVAERVGVKQRLVYYYFHTMDDLIVDTFRRLCRREIARWQAAVAAPRPLHALWRLCIRDGDARLVAEFTSLANRIATLRTEVILFIEESRRLQADALRRAAEASGLSASGLALLATSLALAMNREAELGISIGHDQVAAMVAALLRRLEPPDGEELR